MKQNITLSLEKVLLKKARVIAARRQKSVSRMVSEELEKVVQEKEEYEQAKKRAIALLRSGFHLGGKIIVSRDELHER